MALAKYNTAELADKGRPVAILDPATQTPTGVRFHCLSTDSKKYKEIIRRQQATNREKQKRCRGIYIATAEETEQNDLDLLVGLTIGWDEDVVEIVDGKKVVTGIRQDIEVGDGEYVFFSPEACRNIYADLGYSFIREQVDQFIGDRRDFLPNAK